MPFETFRQAHDPQAHLDWTFPFTLNGGESIAGATVEVVDSTGTSVDAGTDLVIEDTSWGQITGNDHGVTVWITGGTPGTKYYLRCRVTTSAGRATDKTMRLLCRQG